MHYNWPYGLYAILTIVCISLVFFGTSVGIIGICGVYVNSLCILCRFMSEERANRVAPDCTLDTNREIEKRWRFQTDFDLIQIKIIKTGLFFKNVTVHLPCTRTHLHRGGSRYSRNARYKRYRSGLHDIKLLPCSPDVSKVEKQTEPNGVNVYTCNMSMLHLLGTTIDWSEDIMGSRFVFENPNAQSMCGCGSTFSTWITVPNTVMYIVTFLNTNL